MGKETQVDTKEAMSLQMTGKFAVLEAPGVQQPNMMTTTQSSSVNVASSQNNENGNKEKKDKRANVKEDVNKSNKESSSVRPTATRPSATAVTPPSHRTSSGAAKAPASTEKQTKQQAKEIDAGSKTSQIPPETTASGADKPAASSGNKGKKDKPANLVIPPKKPKLTKAERRALQEAQRAAKAAAAGGGGGGGGGGKQPKKNKKDNASGEGTSTASAKQPMKKESSNRKDSATTSTSRVEDKSKERSTPSTKGVESLSHLQTFIDQERKPHEFGGVVLQPKYRSSLHPAVIQLGLEFASSLASSNSDRDTNMLLDDDARCRAMLECFLKVIDDYDPTSKSGGDSAMPTDLRQDLDHTVLRPSFQYWTSECRPHCAGMGNAFTFLKTAVASLPRDIALPTLKEELKESIDSYLLQRMELAVKAIGQIGSSKIADTDDVILVYGSCNPQVVAAVLEEAWMKQGKRFSVIIVDSRPLLEGRAKMKRLRASGIPCTYVWMNALSYVISREVTKVLLGASALMSDGSVYARVGTASVALAATTHNIPVLVCGESYKISHRVQLESFTNNELGNPRHVLEDYYDYDKVPELRVVNLLYDLTPSNMVTCIITEMGILPPSSIAVLLREMNPQDSADALPR